MAQEVRGQHTVWFNKHHPPSLPDYSTFIDKDERDAREQREACLRRDGTIRVHDP